MSNVRPRKTPHHESAFVTRRTARAIARIAWLSQARHHRSAAPVAAWLLCSRRSSGPYPAFAESAQWHRLESKQGGHVPWRRFRLGTKPRFKPVLLSRSQAARDPTHSCSPKVQGHFKRRPCSSHSQPWYASPSKCKHKARWRLTERGLTLPSSGPAYGGPLKSNVRPRKKPHHESTFVDRRTARAIA